jgi:hypothetical protein
MLYDDENDEDQLEGPSAHPACRIVLVLPGKNANFRYEGEPAGRWPCLHVLHVKNFMIRRD